MEGLHGGHSHSKAHFIPPKRNTLHTAPVSPWHPLFARPLSEGVQQSSVSSKLRVGILEMGHGDDDKLVFLEKQNPAPPPCSHLAINPTALTTKRLRLLWFAPFASSAMARHGRKL